ncbi:MAG: 2-C-methyl-D-erythritol 4-phosphate cytidylyltransferase [Buchnera aphidicola (Melaphis rhois)]
MNIVSSYCSKVVAVIPAAGIGSRMLLNIPKQYIKVRGRTILEHSIKLLLVHSTIKKIIIVLDKNDAFFNKLSIASHPKVVSVIGGKFRSCSVLAGILAINDADWVIVHDSVRPYLSVSDLNKIIFLVQNSKIGGILASPMHNTIKYSLDSSNVLFTINRNKLWNALTPQCFPVKLLLACLRKAIKDGLNITDEAVAMEYCGYHPKLVIGSSSNIKITYPEDISLFNFYLEKNVLSGKT